MGTVQDMAARASGAHALGQQAYHILCRVAELLAEIRDNQERGDAHRVKQRADRWVINTDANGNGDFSLYLPPGWSWELKSYFIATAGTTGYVAFYIDQEDGGGGVKVEAGANLVDGAFTEGHYVPEQSRLLIVARGVPANTQASGRVTSKGYRHGQPMAAADGWQDEDSRGWQD